MRRRITALTYPALLCGLLASAGEARAHRLEAEYRVLPGRRVQIESWFDLTGDSPKGAKVQVFRADGRMLTEGELDGKGQFLFSFTEATALKVVVSAGAGHRKELDIPEAELERAVASPPSEVETSRAGPVDGGADRSSRVSLRDVLAGIAFLLGLAAFLLSLRNSRQLRELKDRSGDVPPA
jgi:nickel transport protein